MPNAKKLHQLDQRLERTERQLHVLQKISRLMARKLSLVEVLQAIVGIVMEATEADACLIYLHEGDDLVLCASNTPHPAQIGKLRLKMGEGLTGWVAKERRMVSIGQQAYNDPRFRFFHDLPEDTFEAFLSVPVISRDEVVGVINVQHRKPRRHLGGEMEMLRTVGEQVGCIIVLARIGDRADALMSPVEALLSSPPLSPLAKSG
ncbi:MAG TPA: GAF domain-containing protein [Terriglobia bacterium]|nr:GAF domain-containing protein [Terriglobia bacterium]